MDGMEQFLKVFGSFTVRNLVELGLAIGFFIVIYKKFKGFLDAQYEHTNKEKEKEALRVKKLENITDRIDKFTKKQDDILTQQEVIKDKIENIVMIQNSQQQQLDKIQNSIEERERNKLNDRLVQSYNYYNNIEKNPMKAWTTIESSSFWGLFSEYEKAGGDGFMHDTVQPAMKLLRVVDINDSEGIENLMKNRH